LRDYVVPNKKVVCKVLRIDGNGNINLSLRRVTGKEQKEVLDKHEKERNSLSILKSILGEKAKAIAEQIGEKQSLFEFLQNARADPSLISQYLSPEEAEKLKKILSEKKEKVVSVKKEFVLKSNSPEGMLIIKSMLLPYDKSVSYLAAGHYVITMQAADYRKANQEVQKIIDDISKKSKEEKAEFVVKEK